MRYAFGKYALEPELHELTADGEPVAVEPQVFALLFYLIENRNRVVSKDELIEAVWDGRFVSDAAISSRVKSARRAVGDNGRDQAVIKTLHGKGFRFVADVEETLPETIARQAPPPVTKSGDAWSWNHPLTLVAAALFVVTMLLGALLFNREGETPAAQARFAILPVENATGDVNLEWTELGLMSLVQYALDRGPGVTSISPRAVLAQADGLEVPPDGPLEIEETLADRLARAYNVSHIVLSRLSGPEGEHRLDYVVYASGQPGEQKFVVGADPTVLAGEMSRDLALIAIGRRGLTSVDRGVSDDPFVLEAYARGRALQLEGKAKESRDLFGVAAAQEPDNIWLRYEYALSTRMMGEIDEAESILIELLESARSRNNREAVLAILNALGIIEMRRNNLDAAIAYSEQAAGIANELGDNEKLGIAFVNLGIQHRILGNYAESERALSRSESAFVDAGLPSPVYLLNSWALLKWDLNDLAGAQRYLEEALTAVAALGNKRAEGAVLNNLGKLAETQGQWDRGVERFEASLQVRLQIDDKNGLASSRSGLASLALKQGQPQKAREQAEELLAMYADDANSNVAVAHRYLGEAFYLEGDLGAAMRHHQEARDIYNELGKDDDAKLQEVYLARLDAGSFDRFEAARSELRSILAWAQTNDEAELQLQAHLALSELAHIRGDLEEEAAQLSQVFDISKAIPSLEYEGVAAARLGLLALRNDDEPSAATYLGLANAAHPEYFETVLLAAKRDELANRQDRSVELAEYAKARAGAHWSENNERFLIEARAAVRER
ncbi:MAG: tetratricopeptide repeat protein [Pseudomonadota bacterium]